jgi:hypothetical protein
LENENGSFKLEALNALLENRGVHFTHTHIFSLSHISHSFLSFFLSFLEKQIAMASAALKERMASLVDVVDESEDLCYIDDDATLVIKDSEVPTVQPQSNLEDTAMNPGESSGSKAQCPIDLDAPGIGSLRLTRLVRRRRRRCRMILTRLLRKLPRKPHRCRR